MKKYIFPLILGLLTLNVRAAEPIKVSSEIKQATVFLKGAALHNRATANVPAGRSVLLFTGLSYNVMRESIRLKPEGCQILSVTMRKNFLNLEIKDAEIQKMAEELKKLVQRKKDYADQLTVYANEKQMVLANKSIGGEQNGVDPEKLRQMAEFYRQRLTDILAKEQAIKTEMAKGDKQMAEYNMQIRESAAKNIYPTSEIEVDIQADRAGTAQFDIEYYITEAGWFPAYDFRVAGLTTPMQIDYVAHIYQNSGQDWKNVEVTVSSADPANNGGVPIVQPWFVSQGGYALSYNRQKPQAALGKVKGNVTDATGRPLPYITVLVENSSVGTSTDYEGNFELAIPQGASSLSIFGPGYLKTTAGIQAQVNVVLQSPTALESRKDQLEDTVRMQLLGQVPGVRGSRASSYAWTDGKTRNAETGRVVESNVNTTTSAVSFEYTLKEKMNIPSDGRPYTSQIMKREILAEYRHFASPRLTRDAYLNVFIPEWEKLNLLEGEVNLYFGNSYTGKSVISLRDLKDSLEFSMGKDPNVKIQRTLAYQKTTGGGVLPNKTGEYRWTTEIRNTGTMPIKLTVSEPFPISTEKEIKVELAKELTGARIDTEKGLLFWDITLQPGDQKKLEFGFSVSYPKALNMRFD